MLIDSHCHLDMQAFDDDRVQVIARAREAGVELMLEIAGSDIGGGSLDRGLRIAEENSFVYAAAGVHPHEASLYDNALEQHLLELIRHPKVIGWGEVGLDYHYDHSPRGVQREVFQRQAQLARECGAPLIVHTREAEPDTLAILYKVKPDAGSGPWGVMHCFTGSAELASAAVAMGLMISFSGVVTFKNADTLRSIAQSLPLDSILVETDSPYLAPIPHRGKRNEPAFVVSTAAVISELRGMELSEFAAATTANFYRLFKSTSA